MVREMVGAGPASDRPFVMRRRLFTLAGTASLVLCLAAAVMWLRSTWRGDALTVGGPLGLVIRSQPGLIIVNVSPGAAENRRGWRHEAWPYPAGWSRWSRQRPRWWHRLGFGHDVGWTEGQRVDSLVLPYYFVVSVAGVLAGLFLVQRLRARRRPCTGRCPHCGYDLRATPERCPECGAVPNPPHNLPSERTAAAV